MVSGAYVLVASALSYSAPLAPGRSAVPACASRPVATTDVVSQSTSPSSRLARTDDGELLSTATPRACAARRVGTAVMNAAAEAAKQAYFAQDQHRWVPGNNNPATPAPSTYPEDVAGLKAERDRLENQLAHGYDKAAVHRLAEIETKLKSIPTPATYSTDGTFPAAAPGFPAPPNLAALEEERARLDQHLCQFGYDAAAVQRLAEIDVVLGAGPGAFAPGGFPMHGAVPAMTPPQQAPQAPQAPAVQAPSGLDRYFTPPQAVNPPVAEPIAVPVAAPAAPPVASPVAAPKFSAAFGPSTAQPAAPPAAPAVEASSAQVVQAPVVPPTGGGEAFTNLKTAAENAAEAVKAAWFAKQGVSAQTPSAPAQQAAPAQMGVPPQFATPPVTPSPTASQPVATPVNQWGSPREASAAPAHNIPRAQPVSTAAPPMPSRAQEAHAQAQEEAHAQARAHAQAQEAQAQAQEEAHAKAQEAHAKAQEAHAKALELAQEAHAKAQAAVQTAASDAEKAEAGAREADQAAFMAAQEAMQALDRLGAAHREVELTAAGVAEALRHGQPHDGFGQPQPPMPAQMPTQWHSPRQAPMHPQEQPIQSNGAAPPEEMTARRSPTDAARDRAAAAFREGRREEGFSWAQERRQDRYTARRASSASGADLTRDRAAAARASEMQRVANGADGEGFNWAMQKAGPVFARWPERVKATRVDSL
jgi:hypothetical protein